MLPYSLRLALRHFSRRKIYSAVIVMSLTVGFTCTCLLVSFLVAESSVDSFHEKKDRIFQVMSSDPFGDGRMAFITRPTYDYFYGNYPEMEAMCQISNVPNVEIENAGTFSPIKIVQADTTFFRLFDFPLKGSAEGIVITEAKARQLFGTTDVIGMDIVLKAPDTTQILTIGGTIGQANEKSHLAFDGMICRPALAGGASYMLLHNADAAGNLMAKVNADSLRPGLIAPGKSDYYLDLLERSYFNRSSRMPFMVTRSEVFISIGWIVCGLILFMASFNFINLFLLSMQERRKEQGIKKTLGINLTQTISSLTLETLLYIGVSFVLSIMFVYTLIPVFNNTLETNLTFSYMSKLKVVGVIVMLVFVLGVIAVFISVLQQRRVLPVSMMKNTSAKIRFSKLFFTLQFFVSITLCVCSITIIQQMEFIENEPLGFNRNILQVRPPSNRPEFKNKVLQIGGVDHATLSQGNPINGNMVARYELEDGKIFAPFLFSGDEDFLATLNLHLIDGSLAPGGKLVNETLIKLFNMKDPVGAIIPGTQDRITGVVKDFTCSSFKTVIPPVIISHIPEANQLLIDYSGSDISTVLPKIRAAWTEMFPNDYFSYFIIQDELMKKYSEETLFFKIVVASSITSMVISCFGLFALSWAVIKSRAKEMSIRKVLGAGVTDILALLTTSFAKRLAVAFALAAPAGYYLVDLWLARFVYRVDVNAWIFLIAAAVLATITVVTLGVQTMKASFRSALDEIRD